MTGGPHRADGTGRGALVTVVLAAVTLVVAYIALGGGSYKPLSLADPCKPRPVAAASGFDAVSQQVLRSTLDGAACRLRVTREELAIALVSADSRARFAREHRITEPALEDAIRQGLARAIADAERSGSLTAAQASILRAAAAALPINSLIAGLQTGAGLASAIGGIFAR